MDYRATLNLPQTKFKMKANLAQREPELLLKWEKENLYEQLQQATADRPLYILHDGPPYANGHIHMGHALNKILKDIILKSKRMAGFHCPYVPGWDCHGLPIEHNVDKELGVKKKDIPALSFRQACRRYANKWVKIQKAEFKRLGVLAEWDNPYLTIDYSYEAVIAREFNRFLLSGGVTRSKKPVHWCSSCQTALAEAEVEYHAHTSPSIYVKFRLSDDLGEVAAELAGKKVSLLIWTTTPWTLPANLAVAVNPVFSYAAVAVDDEILIMAEGLVEQVMAAAKISAYQIIVRFTAESLAGRKCHHPFIQRDSLIILADYVTLEAGTGCVHTAPGHGREDYQSALNYNLPIVSPVGGDGCFTTEAGAYSGMFIYDANPAIIDDLLGRGAMFAHSAVTHSYPHCWRCKKPVIFRATEQWFIAMENNELRLKALAAIKQVHWLPKWGEERIAGMVQGRPDWCLSRQRAWGVPLTVISCQQCGEIVMDETVMNNIVSCFEAEGADGWYRHDIGKFIGSEAKCVQCGGVEFIKEEDILDVWFDSGVSFAAVLHERQNLAAPADLYLEGSDQHRGWFQSALLTSVGSRESAPYRSVLTHGFVVDGKGRKMSKSVGNVIAPEKIIKQYGAEILRLWVAAEDYRDDIKISDDILRQFADAYRKIRNTVRFMLGNLDDFEPAVNRIAEKEMDELDRWALYQFELLKQKVVQGYDDFEFHLVFHALHNFCTVMMSSLYLDIIKDRLYTSPAAGRERRAAQSVLYEIVDGLLRLMAPILTFMAAEAWEYLPYDPTRTKNVFAALFPEPQTTRLIDDNFNLRWERLLKVRGELTKALEIARQDKVIGHSLEAELTIAAAGELGDFLLSNWELLRTITIVSSMQLVDKLSTPGYASREIPELVVVVHAATGQKCERCWLRSTSVGVDSMRSDICKRCVTVVNTL